MIRLAEVGFAGFGEGICAIAVAKVERSRCTGIPLRFACQKEIGF